MSDCRKCAKCEECAVDEDCGLFVAKPQTKGDKIRAMTDEKLAEKIAVTIDCSVCKSLHHSENDECPCNPHQACEDFWLGWLKGPADPWEGNDGKTN